jgi:Calcineurin-like phosphoesterase
MSSVADEIDYAVGIGAVEELLNRNGILPSEVGRLHRLKDVRLYQQGAKVDKFDKDGRLVGQELEVQDLVSVVLSPVWEDGPEWPVIAPGPAVKLPSLKAPVTKRAMRRALVIPDIQVGYYHGPDGTLIATHDEGAVEMMLVALKLLKPDLVVMVGDNLDLPELGKYRLSPAFQLTTQPSIDYMTTLCFRIRAAVGPDAEIVWLAGNHEERLVNYVLDNAKSLFGLRRGAETPDAWPVLSVPFLCRLDESNVQYMPGYPASDFWINERLQVIHGDRVRSGGSTAEVYLKERKTSVIYGHVHRREWAERTFDKFEGSRTIMAASPGTLARVDGAVPSTKGSIDLHGRPLTITENWQQGIAYIDYEDAGDHLFFYHQVPFINGKAIVLDSLVEAPQE